MNSQVNWEQDCTWGKLRSFKGGSQKASTKALEGPHLESLHALSLIAQGMDVSYTPQLAARRIEWEAFERDIALLLPKRQRSECPRREFTFSPNLKQELRAELLLAEPGFLEPASPRPNWRRPEPAGFHKQREEVSRPLRPRRPPALQAISERRDRGNFRRLAWIGGIAVGAVLSLGCYHAVYGTTSITDTRVTKFMSTLLPRLTMLLSNMRPGIFGEYNEDLLEDNGSRHVTIADLIGATGQSGRPALVRRRPTGTWLSRDCHPEAG